MTDSATGIPEWWLIISGAFFVINILFFMVMTAILVILTKAIVEMKPKVASLEENIQALVLKVHSIAENVEQLSATLKETVTQLSGNAKSISGSAEIVARTAGGQFEKVSPLIVGAITTFRLIKAFNEMRANKKDQDREGTGKKKGRGTVGTALAVASHFLRR